MAVPGLACPIDPTQNPSVLRISNWRAIPTVGEIIYVAWNQLVRD
jgi:hypothetical protein